MDIHTNIPLKNYTTMKIGGNARFMVEARTADEVATICRNAKLDLRETSHRPGTSSTEPEAVLSERGEPIGSSNEEKRVMDGGGVSGDAGILRKSSKERSLPIFILGGGSNIIVKDEGFNGIVIHVRIPGFEVVNDDINTTTIRIGAGEWWDSVVKRTVDMRLSGIEAMSAIPGTAGAGPVQNMGAYGQEIADTLQSLDAYDTETDTFVILKNADCNFSYRNSIFRGDSAGRYVITSITLKLSKNQPQPPFYDTLQKYLDENNIGLFTQDVIRNAVIELRKNKLPDPKSLPNSGSFFKNAIVETWQLDDLRAINPNIPVFNMGNNRYKIPTGWLIEQADLKGKLLHGMRIYDKNALVLVNESATSYNDLADARDEIISRVRDMFHIQIQQEPLEI